jgi:hypothetical protein
MRAEDRATGPVLPTASSRTASPARGARWRRPHRERAPGGQVERAGQRQLLVGAEQLAGVRAGPREEDGEVVVGRRVACLGEQRAGQADDLVDGDVADLDLGEAAPLRPSRSRPSTLSAVTSTSRVLNVASSKVTTCPPASREASPSSKVPADRPSTRISTAGDPAVPRTGERLCEADPPRRHRLERLDEEPLPDHLAEGADPPHGRGVAVEGVGGPLLAGVGDLVAVGGRLHPLDAALLDDGAGVVPGGGEEGQALLHEVLVERHLARLLGEAGVLPHAAPPARPAPVAVGQHEGGPVVEGPLAQLGSSTSAAS